MAKKEVEIILDEDEFKLDDAPHPNYFEDETPVTIQEEYVAPVTMGRPTYTPQHSYSNIPESCLRNERVFVKHMPKQTGLVDNPKHILFGGLAEGCEKGYCVPLLLSGTLKNPLTNEEKAYLEYALGLEPNALSVYKREDNFWRNRNVYCGKDPLPLNLADPNDYIKYKILLCNEDEVASSLDAYQSNPLPTIKFYISREDDDAKLARKGINATMTAFMEYGKIEQDALKLRVILEQAEGKPLASTTKLDFLQLRAAALVQSDPKLFISLATDVTLDNKVLIKKAIEANVIQNRGGHHFVTSDNMPLCGPNQEPDFHTAAKYLNLPSNQSIKLKIEATLNSR